MCVGVWYSFFLHVTSGERRLRRRSANILLPTSDERSLAGGGAESYRCPPVGGSSPELAIAPAALLRRAEAAHILMVANKKAEAISSRDSHCLHLLRSIKRVLNLADGVTFKLTTALGQKSTTLRWTLLMLPRTETITRSLALSALHQ